MSFIALFAMTLGFTSCDPNAPEGSVKVTNNSSMMLSSFTIVFCNEYGENIDKKNFGDFAHGEVCSMVIPIGASRWYCGTLINSTWYFSPFYNTSTKSVVLTQSMVYQWTTN